MKEKFFFKTKNIDNIELYKSTTYNDFRGKIWSINLKKIKFNFSKFTYANKNSLRGFHGDNKTWKLVTCIYGKSFCVVVNFDKKSKLYLKKYYFNLSDKNKLSILLPPKMLLAWLTISKKCIFYYNMSFYGEYNDVKKQISLKWNDKLIKAKWPITKPLLSKRDS